MRYLLDTHVALWWIFGDPRLSDIVHDLIADRSNEVLTSSASAWEIATKWRLGKLPAAAQLVRDIPGWLAKAGFTELAIRMSHAQRAGTWPQAHRDPFDRMLAAQSALENVPIISADSAFRAFGIQVIW
jgi:PIN domain nuclease of toxin-antitoxin system